MSCVSCVFKRHLSVVLNNFRPQCTVGKSTAPSFLLRRIGPVLLQRKPEVSRPFWKHSSHMRPTRCYNQTITYHRNQTPITEVKNTCSATSIVSQMANQTSTFPTLVELKDLWKIKAPLESVEGFNVQAFDKLIENCRVENEENEAEPHSMWEYPCRALSEVFDALRFNFTSQIPDEKQDVNGAIEFTRRGCCNAVIFWMDYVFDENITMSTGLTKEMEISSDGYIKNWVKFCKQGVFFVHKPRDVGTASINSKLKYTVTFEPNNGSLTMQCNIVEIL